MSKDKQTNGQDAPGVDSQTPGYVAKTGDIVMDNDGNTGMVIEAGDIHNILVQFDNGGSGLYCMVESCDHYDPLQAT